MSAAYELFEWWSRIWSARHSVRPQCDVCGAITGLTVWWPGEKALAQGGENRGTYADFVPLCHVHADAVRAMFEQMTAPGGRWEHMPATVVAQSVLSQVAKDSR